MRMGAPSEFSLQRVDTEVTRSDALIGAPLRATARSWSEKSGQTPERRIWRSHILGMRYESVIALESMSQATMHRLLVRPKSLTDLAHDSIRQFIVGGELAMGAQLSEATLAAQLGISKTPVREALLRLRVDGLIEIQPQRGTFVFSLTPRQVEEICAFREVIEVSAVKLAMEARTPRLVGTLQANVREMSLARKSPQLEGDPSTGRGVSRGDRGPLRQRLPQAGASADRVEDRRVACAAARAGREGRPLPAEPRGDPRPCSALAASRPRSARWRCTSATRWRRTGLPATSRRRPRPGAHREAGPR